MDLELLKLMSVVLITAVIVLLIFNKLKLPSMIGLFLTGIILNFFMHSTDLISAISELGVIFLLFIIGLEFSIEKFSSIKHYALIGGVLQVLITTIIVAVITFILGFPLNSAIFMGFLICFSSTAIVMKIIQKNGLNHTLKGKVTLGILIFQDIAVILVLLFTPLLGGQSIDISTLPRTLLNVLGLVIIIVAMGKYIVPYALKEAASTKNRDLFMLLILFICLGTTFATSNLGISPELGAFIAGLIISNTEFSHQTLGYIQPFQDVFMSLFFISIGFLIDIHYFISNIVIIVAMALLIIAIKFIATFLTGRALKLSLDTTVTISILLSQIGEFSFVLAREGISYGIISSELFTTFLTISIITMSLTPLLTKYAPAVCDMLMKIPYFKKADHKLKLKGKSCEEIKEIKTVDDEISDDLENHTIVVGYGLTGRNIAYSCQQMDVPYICVDNDPIVVEKGQLNNISIIYGDGFSESVLEELKVKSANVLVVATSVSDHLIQIVDAAKRLNPNIHVIVRTKYVKNVNELYDAGADEVIPEEFETSIMMFRLIMDYYDKDLEDVNDLLQELRGDHYTTLRSFSDVNSNFIETPDGEYLESTCVDCQENLGDFKFSDFNLSAISVIRDKKIIHKIDDSFNLRCDDVIIFKGSLDNIEKFTSQR